jgi:exopolysaccharide production protein ExoY
MTAPVDSQSTIAMVEHRNPMNSVKAVGGASKRVFDVVFAGSVMAVLLPLLLLIAAIIVLHDGGPPLYGQTRIGRNRVLFRCWKFRTMVLNADGYLAEHLQANPNARLEWQATRKLKRDPRITPIGKLLRASSLDELPQLLNILRGDMSVVGPRPVVPDELSMYGNSSDDYCRARPGLTGAWQVSGRNDTTYDTRVRLDSDYVRGWNFRRDIVIILRTIPAVVSSRGCY